jgi:predicted RNase H-like HicB family nuclease
MSIFGKPKNSSKPSTKTRLRAVDGTARRMAATRPARPNKAPNKLNAPFDPKLLTEARMRAQAYTLLLSQEDGEFVGAWLEFPGVLASAKTRQAAHTQAIELLTSAIATMLEAGEALPLPAAEQQRTEQVNIRLTRLERTRLETFAKQQGFRSVSDYMRFSALQRP